MKKCMLIMVFIWGASACMPRQAVAQIPILEIIKAAVVKAIKAADLAIQRIQNQTIKLQNAQKALENALSKLKLEEIGGWVEKQREQYAKYYEELARVRNAITYYNRIKATIELQVQLVNEYSKAYAAIRQDANFSADELLVMLERYTAILEESIRSIDDMQLVVRSFTLQMSDADRLALIASAQRKIQEQLSRLRRYTRSNALLSMQRIRERSEADKVKSLYGIE